MKLPIAGVLAVSLLVGWSASAQTPAHPPPAFPGAKEAEGQPPADKLDGLVESRKPTVIATGFQFTEGPLWIPQRGVLIFSDIPANAVYEISPGPVPIAQEHATVHRRPSGNANGNALLADGRIVSAQHNGSVTRCEPDGAVTVLASEYQGQRLNSPNDLVVAKDGSIYFTDPPFGVSRPERKLDFAGIFRIALDGTLTLESRELALPNGIDFSPDEKKLYVSEYRKSEVWVFDIADDGSLSNHRLFFTMGKEAGPGGADGLKTDVHGNVWATGPGGVWVISPEAELLGHIPVRSPTNLCFGGPEGKTLFITAGPLVYSLKTKVTGRKRMGE